MANFLFPKIQHLAIFFPKLNYEIDVDYLLRLITEYSHGGATELIKNYNKKYKTKKIMLLHCFKIKKLIYVFTQLYRNEIYFYLKHYLGLIKKGFNFIYCDESSVNRKIYKKLKLRIQKISLKIKKKKL